MAISDAFYSEIDTAEPLSIIMKISVFRDKSTKQISNFVQGIVNKTFYYSKSARSKEIKKFSPLAVKKDLKDKNKLFLIAKDDNRIAGVLNGYYEAGMFWIDWIVVGSSFRRNGVAKSLMNYLEKKLKREKIHKIWCDCRTTNKESISLLKKLKFKKIAKIKRHWYKQDFYLWQKYL